MFRKVLIANRGEIAVRIIRACQELGLETVAVYSEADRTALHVRYADEAYHIGPPQANESYLRMDKIIDVGVRAGVDAVHPGYGFLAENAQFARACAEAGLVWIGPPPEAITLLGDKVEARRTMQAAGVPVVPGTDSDMALDDDSLRAAASQVGYPLLIKAAAGGGGKGMRAVSDPAEFDRSLAAARREAKGAFGDDRVYLERLISGARHIEFQILADHHGSVIHLGERECSIQRRHQKMLEEAPSPFMTPELRERMGAVAVQAARAANYANAGTVEFLVDKDRNFYFLEVNTRLQVEHPVTEMVTGVDIVKEQLRIASGRKLRYEQEDINLKGWAMECRISSEDPFNSFLPSTGKVTSLVEPNGAGSGSDRPARGRRRAAIPAARHASSRRSAAGPRGSRSGPRPGPDSPPCCSTRPRPRRSSSSARQNRTTPQARRAPARATPPPRAPGYPCRAPDYPPSSPRNEPPPGSGIATITRAQGPPAPRGRAPAAVISPAHGPHAPAADRSSAPRDSDSAPCRSVSADSRSTCGC